MSISAQIHKYLRSYPQWGFAPPPIQLHRNLQRFGSEYGGYFLDPELIGSNAVVYSLGIGNDIEFDRALIDRFGVTVHAFDPTPRVKAWLASQELPKEFHFSDVGIADFDGEATFYLPSHNNFVSHSVIPARQYSSSSIRVPVVRLTTAMKRLGHTRIDVLKMDIEGAEYGVLEDLARERIRVDQLLVEFHHRLSSIGTTRTKQAISLLQERGMRVCYICPRLQIFTLVRVE